MKKSNKGFMTLDILFGLTILIIISLLLVYFLQNNIKLSGRNNRRLEMLNITDNFIKELTNNKTEDLEILSYRKLLMEDRILKINLTERIFLTIRAHYIGDKLYRLNIETVNERINNEKIELVIVVEEFK